MDQITIYQFTDPTCIWCWGNEPTMRAIDYLYGDKVRIEFIMGGLIEDISTLYNIEGSKEHIITEANHRIHENWLIASHRHGMPVSEEPLTLYTEQYRSSFPQNIAYEAAKRIDKLKSKSMLRRLREATFLENRRTSQMDVLIELAIQAGLNAAEFIEQYTYGDAQADFMRDRLTCRRNGITGFPSYMACADNTNIILGGYQNLSTLQRIISRLSKDRIKPRRLGATLQNIRNFIKHYSICYMAEIEVAFSLDKAKTDLIIDTLLKEGSIMAESAGNGTRLRYTA